MLSFAERAWRGALNNRYGCWAKLPSPQDPAFKEYQQFEQDLLEHATRLSKDWPFPYVRQTHIPWRLIGPFPNEGDIARKFPVEKSIRREYQVAGNDYRWDSEEHIGGTIHINHFFGFPGHLPKSKPGTVYALTHVYSPRDQEAGFWIGFNGQSRSGGRASGPNPEIGEWSIVDSQVWVNDEIVEPPKWENPGLGRNTAETPYEDENYYFRQPTPVHLDKGWNKILIKAPHAKRARKWMFTFVPAPGEGKHLEFSTSPNGQ